VKYDPFKEALDWIPEPVMLLLISTGLEIVSYYLLKDNNQDSIDETIKYALEESESSRNITFINR
jgi:hypothetical protein